MDDVVIVGMARTPIGALMGELGAWRGYELGAEAIEGAMRDSQLDKAGVDSVLMGNCLGAGQGQAPARQAALRAGLTKSVQTTTLSKMCGSGMQAVVHARQALMVGEADMVVAGGMESMSNAPFLLTHYRGGRKYGSDAILDHVEVDGLQDAYEGAAMGEYADLVANDYQFTREMQDAYALETLARAKMATAQGRFKREITPIQSKPDVIEIDELPERAKPDRIPTMKPAFTTNGTVTAASASAISDGAAALVLMRAGDAEKRGARVLARIVSTAAHAHEPAYFTTAPVPAIQKALDRAGWKADDVDLWEVNEAFAVVPMIAMAELNIPHAKLNVHGGACALGHPIGASGARVLVTLINAMEIHGKTKGVAALCIGGGEGIAMCVERKIG